jgi:hypothetical protein
MRANADGHGFGRDSAKSVANTAHKPEAVRLFTF